MLTQFGGYPAFEIEYDKTGALVDPGAQAEAIDYFARGDGKAVDDIVIISHGWNNDIAQARQLYGNFFNAFRTTQPGTPVAHRSFAILALFWPSKRFADTDLIPGGAAGVAVGDANQLALLAQLETFAAIFGPEAEGTIAELRALVPNLENDLASQDAYVKKLVSLVPQPSGETDEGLDEARAFLDRAHGQDVLRNLKTPFVPVLPAATGGATAFGLGSASGISGFFHDLAGGITSAATNLGNVLAYYAMKDRAGIVARTGAITTVRALRAARPVPRLHLVGHSFGGRLVTALANALRAGEAPFASMTLLEPAYSHNGMGKNWDGAGNDGSFRPVIADKKVAGPILITHSAHDFPVGTCYPIASRLMNQVASAIFGGPDDKYGGLGRNGAQHTPEAAFDTLHLVGTSYNALPPGKVVRNLNGDGSPTGATITSHGDVAKPEITYAMQMHL